VSAEQGCWSSAGRQTQVGENLHDRLGINDGGDDLQARATARGGFDVDIEYPFEQARPTDARWG